MLKLQIFTVNVHFNPVNTEVVNINRRLSVCVALVKIKFQKNNIGVISVFGILLVF